MTRPAAFMTGGSRLAAWSAVLVATLTLGVPAGAQSALQSVNQPAETVQTGDTEPPEPQPTEADPDNAVPAVEVVRYSGQDPYVLSLRVAQALVDAEDGTSEWVVLASGESWADAAMAGPLATSLGAPVLLVPPGGLQSPTARPDLAAFLRSSGVRRVVIVGSPEVLPNHEPSVLYGLGMLPRNIERIHGTDPIGTSVAVAERMGLPADMGELGRTVIIASSQNVADAVAVGPLAAAGPFPLLLTAPDELDPRITKYLTEHEVSHAILVGGEAAMTPAVEDAIKTAGAQVTRLAGIDRYHTAALAMDLLAESPRCADDAIDNIGLVLAEEPRLALTAGRLLGPQCIPLLFTDADRLAPVTQNHLYLYQHRTGVEPAWHLIGDEVTIDATAIERPPVRMATVADNPDGDGQHIVVLDEHHQPTRYLLDAGFEEVTDLRWSADRAEITFTGVREGEPASYDLDTRHGSVQRRSRFADWLAPLVRDGWVDPRPSPDRAFVVFRAAAQEDSGHSLFSLNVNSGDIQWLTENSESNVHHLVSATESRNARWLPDGRRLIYTFQDAAQAESDCDDVPMSQAHIVDVETRVGHRIEFDGYAIGDALQLSPDGTHLVVQSFPSYELAPAQDGWSFWTFNCVYFGTGSPALTVFDLRGPEPLRITGSGLVGQDPEWSPDGRRLVFRAPHEPNKGHSLYLVDVEQRDVARLTGNESDDVHHVVVRWLSGSNRLIYSVTRIEELEGECAGFPRAQVQRSPVPHAQLHIADVRDGESIQLPYSGFVLGSWRHEDLDFSPDGGYLVTASYPGYQLALLQGGCPYWPQGTPQLHVYDLSASVLEELTIAESHGYGGLWSPDSRHFAYYRRTSLGEGSIDDALTVRDMRDGTEWTLEPPDAPDGEVRVSFSRWSRDGSRLLVHYRPTDVLGYYGDIALVAVPEAERLFRLDFAREPRSSLTFGGFSPDGLQLMRTQRGIYSDDIGTLYINDLDRDGSVLGSFNTFAATDRGTAARLYIGDARDLDQYFDMISDWTPRGIFVASYSYSLPYVH